MVKRSIQQEDITLINIYVPNIEAPKYIKQIFKNIEGAVDSNTVTVGNCNTPLHRWIDIPGRISTRKQQP